MGIIIRTANIEDLPRIIELENARWSPEQRCSPENFEKRLAHYQEGFLIAEQEHKLLASFYAIKRRYDPTRPFYWIKDSGIGTGSTHEPNGDALFSVSCTVSQLAPSGTYRRMMESWRELAQHQQVTRIYAGSRIPGLGEFDGSVEEYVESVAAERIFDPALSKAMACGFEVGRIIPDYFDDPVSRNFGVEIYNLVDRLGQ